jgi:hypothetical protein
VPATTLLRRFGWHHLKVKCRDGEGLRTTLDLRRRTHEIVELGLSDGQVARLTNVQAGRLRAALREVLVDQSERHCVLPADMAGLLTRDVVAHPERSGREGS